MLVDVGFQDGVKVLEFDVANKSNYKYLDKCKRNKEEIKLKSVQIKTVHKGYHFM